MVQQMPTSLIAYSLIVQRPVNNDAGVASDHDHPHLLLGYVRHTCLHKSMVCMQPLNQRVCAGAVADMDAVQSCGAQRKVPQEAFWRGQNTASFNPAAVQEFVQA